SWTYVESVDVRGKFQELPLLTGYDDNLQAKYKLVDATVSWDVNSEYSISSTSPRGTTGSLPCTNSEIVVGSGTDNLQNLDISYAIGEPVELPEAGELILEIEKDGTYKLDGRFFATVTDTERNTCGGERVNPNSIQYRLPVVGTYAGGKTIARSGLFANAGCVTEACYTDSNAFTLMIAVDPMSTDIPEENGKWTADWTLYLP
ncbi:MAG: hypothetical protein Q7T16_00565, partial [Candidatus Burarchaeum sp.]